MFPIVPAGLYEAWNLPYGVNGVVVIVPVGVTVPLGFFPVPPNSALSCFCVPVNWAFTFEERPENEAEIVFESPWNPAERVKSFPVKVGCPFVAPTLVIAFPKRMLRVSFPEPYWAVPIVAEVGLTLFTTLSIVPEGFFVSTTMEPVGL